MLFLDLINVSGIVHDTDVAHDTYVAQPLQAENLLSQNVLDYLDFGCFVFCVVDDLSRGISEVIRGLGEFYSDR